MIIKMFKTTLLCLASDKEHALKRLQELGVMHVELSRKADSEDRTEVEQAVNQLERVVNSLSGRTTDVKSLDHTGREIAEKTLELLDEGTAFNKRLETLKRDLDKLEPWGDFSNEIIAELEKSGIRVYLCTGSENDLESCWEKGTCEIIREDKGRYNFVLIATEELDEAALPLASIPENLSLNKCLEEIAVCRRELERIDKALNKMSVGLDLVKEYALEVEEKLEFLTSRDGMIHEGEIAYIEGFVPQTEIENLKAEAGKNGWALLYEKAEVTDPSVPTLLKIPKIFRIVEPLMNFLGISPGYDEVDVSVCFLFFLTIYFSMIVGDGGYGAVFLIGSLALRPLAKAPMARKAVNLLSVFSIGTIIWGGLTGTWFGMDSKMLPEWMRGIEFFSKPEIKDRNIQLFCFILAIAHLTTGRLWRAVLYWNAPRAALGEIGWAVILWANFFMTLRLLVFPGKPDNFIMVLYVIGLVLVLLCGVNWKDMGDVFNFPFGVIGTFVDILSYIRLYAVGMAGFYIANSFNGMGASVWSLGSGPMTIILIFFGVIVILFGHLLNIALCLMGVLVHGVRLNTLEFSNHIGLRWAGLNYKPFAKKTLANIDKGEEK